MATARDIVAIFDRFKQPSLRQANLSFIAMAMHKNHEGPAIFEMLNKSLEQARDEKRVTEERNIRILMAQMHVTEVVYSCYYNVSLLFTFS